jgi:hypothetical protein
MNSSEIFTIVSKRIHRYDNYNIHFSEYALMDSVNEETPSNMEDEPYMFKRRPGIGRSLRRAASRAGRGTRRAVDSSTRAGRRAVRSAGRTLRHV